MTLINSIFFKELQKFSVHELEKKFGCSDNLSEIIKYLINKGFLKKEVKSKKSDDCIDYYVNLEGEEFLYYFDFVGIIVVDSSELKSSNDKLPPVTYVIKCYPKYIKNNEEPKEDFKLILKVLLKYHHIKSKQISVKENILKMFSNIDDNLSMNYFSIILFLIHDFYEYGVYLRTDDVIENNGLGEIHWDKTINSTFPMFLRNRPYYFELKTRKRITNDSDFFTRLHEYVLTKISSELKEVDLIDLFDLTEIDLSEESLEDFGETEYILYRIEKELAVQFSTRKQILLKALYVYISTFEEKILSDVDCLSVFGTCCFYAVWEDVCKVIFKNMLETKISALPINPEKSSSNYITKNKDKKLVELIEKPYWAISDAYAEHTLKPDLVTLNENDFIIFDAKYYVPNISKAKSISEQPGIGDITKQYLYQLAYKDFISACGFRTIFNCFLLPTCEDKVIDGKFVRMEMLEKCDLQNILVKFLPAKEAYDCYLSGKLFQIHKLELKHVSNQDDVCQINF